MDKGTARREFGWQEWAAALCFIAAVLSIALGFVFTTGWLLNAQIHPVLHGVGLVLLILGIPILILSGHFMDLKERKSVHGCR